MGFIIDDTGLWPNVLGLTHPIPSNEDYNKYCCCIRYFLKALSIGLFYISPSLNYTKYSFCIIFCFGIILPLFYGIIKKNSIVMRYII